jgi:phage terminase small subunit
MAKLTEKRQKFVAAYLGAARLNASEAARIAGYAAPGTEGHRLLQIAEIQEAIAEWRDEIRKQGIADQTFRIERLNDLDRRYWELIEARSEQYVDVPGGETGLLVKQYKSDGDGGLVAEYVADVAITKEIRELQKQMATELGEWTEKRNIEGTLTLADLAILAIEDEPAAGGDHSPAVEG